MFSRRTSSVVFLVQKRAERCSAAKRISLYGFSVFERGNILV